MRPNCGHEVEIAHTPLSAYLSTFKHLPQTSNLHDRMTVGRTRPLGLAYTDDTGKSVLLAHLRSSIGELVPPNQVVYPGALADDEVLADLQLTYRIGSFEADVVLRSKPASPAAWGLNPSSSHLQVWTEVFEAPPVTKRNLTVRCEDPIAKTMLEFRDEFLDFGLLCIGQGRAFALGGEQAPQGNPSSSALDSVPVAKEWTTIPDPDTGQVRTFLNESVPYPALQPLLDTLNRQGAVLPATT